MSQNRGPRVVCGLAWLLLALGICHAGAAFAQLSAPVLGTQDTARRPGETETQQVGGQRWYHYARIGALRCGQREAIVGADFSDGTALSGIRLHCAAVSCAGATCAWDSGSVHDGSSVGAELAPDAPDCPQGTVVAGFGADNANDSPTSVVLRCARLAGAPVDAGRSQFYPIVSPGPGGAAIPPPQNMRIGSVTAYSAYRDTLANAAQAYGAIVARSDYYSVMNTILQSAPGTKDIRFFDAASQVTNSTHVGAIEGLGFLAHQQEARDVLAAVNQRLFAGNIQVLRKLLIAGGPYGNPTSALPPPQQITLKPFGGRCTGYAATAISVGIVQNGQIQALSLYCGSGGPAQAAPGSSCRPSYPAMQFDLAMVDYEQGEVEKMLKDGGAIQKALPVAAQDIDRDINLNGDAFRPVGGMVLGMVGLLDREPFQWAKTHLHTNSLTFLSLEDRVAIGKALIFKLHGCTVMDYLYFMNNASER